MIYKFYFYFSRLKLNLLQIMPFVHILNEMLLDKFYIFPAFTTTDKFNIFCTVVSQHLTFW